MKSIPILIFYGGFWDENWRFNNFRKRGFVLNEDSKLHDLLSKIEKMIPNQDRSKLIVQIQESDGAEPIPIDNEDSFDFYWEIRKQATEVSRYPIIITEELPQILDYQNNSSSSIQLLASETSSTQKQLSISLERSCSAIIDYGRLLSKQVLEEEKSLQHVENNIISTADHSHIEAGQVYVNKEMLKKVMSTYAITHNFQFRVQKSCQKEYHIVCYIKECEWSMRASRKMKTDLFSIRKFNNVHTCPIKARMDCQREATSTIIAEKIKTKFLNPDRCYNPKDIQNDMKVDFGMNIQYHKAWRAKEKALENLRGKASDSYNLIPSFMHILSTTNPGSVDCYTTVEDKSFEHAFMAVYASIEGFKYCRPIIVVDGTFLKAAYKGTLLTATSEDPTGKIFPLAFAVVDSENDNSWK